MNLQTASLSLLGRRANNEDFALHFRLGDDHVAILCDGMGGYPDGEYAARYFAEAFQQAVQTSLPAASDTPGQILANWLQRSLDLMCPQLVSEGRSSLAHTTCVAAWLSDSFTVVGHVGDSRAYILNTDAVLWRTRDHNLFELAMANGDIPKDDNGRARGNHSLLYRSVSCGEPLKPSLVQRPPLQPGETLVLCSDGAWFPLQDEGWTDLYRGADLKFTLRGLLETAVTRSGDQADNATALVLRRPLED